MEAASSSSPVVHERDRDLGFNTGNDERIRNLVVSYNLSERRRIIMREAEEAEDLKRLHARLECLVYREPDSKKRRRLLRVVPIANRFRELLLYMKNLRDSSDTASASNYAQKMHESLSTVIDQSFEDEYRTFADLLGMLETLAEALICDVEMFGIQCPHQNCMIRKLIANALTNLSFSSLSRKRRICKYSKFVECVMKMISGLQSVAQAYAGLIRNLAWNADPEMTQQLQCTVPVLIQATLRAYDESDHKTLGASLAALWNLSYSTPNQQTICANRRFLEILIELLQNDPQQETLVEAVSGILKYASQSFVQKASEYICGNHLEKLSLRLIDLLKCSSFTTINNCLYTLNGLLKYERRLRSHVASNQKAMTILYHLCTSTVTDVRTTVRVILEYLTAGGPGQPLVRSLEGSRTGIAMNTRPDTIALSYSGGAIAPACSYFVSPRLLKLRSAQQYTPDLFSTSDDGLGDGARSISNTALVGQPTYHCFAPPPGITLPKYDNLLGERRHVDERCLTGLAGTRSQGKLETGYENLSFDHGGEINLYKAGPHPKQRNDLSDDDGDGIDFDDSEVEPNQSSAEQLFDPDDSICIRRKISSQSLKSVSLDQTNIFNCCSSTPVSNNQTLSSSPTICNSRSDCAETTAELSVIHVQRVSRSRIKESTAGKENQPQLEHPISAKDDVKYGDFDRNRVSEVLNHSIESAMPKRTETNDDFLADMIEQAQPKAPIYQNMLRSNSPKVTATASSAPTTVSTNTPSCEVLYLACV